MSMIEVKFGKLYIKTGDGYYNFRICGTGSRMRALKKGKKLSLLRLLIMTRLLDVFEAFLMFSGFSYNKIFTLKRESKMFFDFVNI